MTELPIACKLTESEFRARKDGLLQQMRDLAKEVKAIDSGYALRFAAEDGLLLKLAKIMEQERKCCPFLKFRLQVECATGTIGLDITGPEGTKKFLHELLRLT